MRTATLAIALLISGAAYAQTQDPAGMPDSSAAAETAAPATDTMPSPAIAPSADSSAMPATTTMSAISRPGNQNPERDARKIAVISDPATVPDGFNGVSGTAMGGPLIDPATNEPVAANDEYPACSAKVTDNCLQSYERGRMRS